ncbi:MAG: stage II sporulation protein M [Acidobacteria bacterium]|nr:stage II sporulation protein M [Acidobacteriota bacterium]
MNRFINDNKDNWQRLEDLLGMIRGGSLRGLSRLEVRELGQLYRRAAADLAIARAETRDPKLIKYLNSLVVRAHGKIYRAEGDGASIIKSFFSTELPQAVRATSRFTTISFLVFMACAVASFSLAYSDQAFSNMLGLADVQTSAETDGKWWLSLNQGNQIGSSAILTNNIRVAFFAFALGAFFCIGSIYIIGINGVMIGGILGVCYRVNPAFGTELVNFMVAHGVVELACIFIAGGAGMAIGYSIIDPGDLTRSQALKRSGVQAAKIVIGCAVFLVVAGVIEGFISPSSLPVYIKYATGILTGLAMFSYLFFAGRSSMNDNQGQRSN